MKVCDLKPGTSFRILKKTYRLLRLGAGAAYVEVQVEHAEGDATQVTRLRYHIAPTAEVDEVLAAPEPAWSLEVKRKREQPPIVDEALLERVKARRRARKADGQHLSARRKKMTG